MQAIIKGVGGTVETYFLGRQVTSCTVSLYTGSGAAKVSAATATTDSVATTIATQGTRNATTLTLASGTGVVTGRRYLVGGSAEADPPEVVVVRDLAGTVATLWGPLAYAHASGATFKGLRVSYAVSSTTADTLWWDGYADFTPSSGDVQTETVDCVLRKIPERLIDETDVFAIFPKGLKMLDAEFDIEGGLVDARSQFLRSLGGKFRAHCMLGTEHMRMACSLEFWLARRHSMGAEYAQIMDQVERDRDREIAKLQSQIPTDNDQDGATTGTNDGAYTTIQLGRA